MNEPPYQWLAEDIFMWIGIISTPFWLRIIIEGVADKIEGIVDKIAKNRSNPLDRQ